MIFGGALIKTGLSNFVLVGGMNHSDFVFIVTVV